MQIIAKEEQEADAFMDWAHTQPLLREYLIHIRNERKTSWFLGKKYKHLGVKSGVSDYFLPHRSACGTYCGMWLELKRKKLYKVSAQQQYWIDKMTSQGYFASLAIGADEAIKITKWYLGQK